MPYGAEAREMESYPVVKLQSLDKITARTMIFEANVGSTVKFGSLYIKVQACSKAAPVEQPESAAFLQIWELKAKEKERDGEAANAEPPKEDAQWIFSGWMFASSPALSHMDHPVYDVWVLDCKNSKGQKAVEVKTVDDPAPTENKETPPAPESEIQGEELSPLGD